MGVAPGFVGQFLLEQAQLIRLTEEQYTILDSLNRQRRMVIGGFAGSGKTMLAVEKAMRLARAGFRVLLTCYNKRLATDLRRSLAENPLLWTGLDIYHFHDLCTKLAKEYGIPLPSSDTEETYFDRDLPDLLLKVSQFRFARYDAIIVDEAQDFHTYWWRPLQALLRDPDHGIFYLFFDENQRLYQQQPTLPFDSPSFSLIVNCRTTRCIHQQVLKFYRGEVMPTAKGPEGRPVELSTYETVESLQQALKAVLLRLLTEEQIPASEIVVLTPYSRKKSQVTSQIIRDQIELRWHAEDEHIQVETIYSFKGLEQSVVVLVELERWLTQGTKVANLEKLLYVGCSRARHYLIILLPKQVPRTLRALFETNASALATNETV